jgi:two-component system chemotaxis response regulator CheB
MRPVRVMVVDDSVVVRLLVAEAIRAEKGLELAGTAANGRIALEKLADFQPDVIVLDVEMPVLDGLATLVELRKVDRRIPVVMFSTLTSAGASATVEALTRGASDYVQKPSASNRDHSVQVMREELVPKLLALGERMLPRAPRPASAVRPPLRRNRPAVDVLVIGVSTGGPNALADMLPGLPADLPVPVLIVQHMPPLFTEMLAKRLNALTPLTVREAQGGEVLRAGDVWIAPGGKHLSVRREGGEAVLWTHDDPPVNSCRPAVDVLFDAASQVYGAGVLAVVMTGMGSDGFNGVKQVHARGGQVLAQDQASSVVWGMPRFVAESGLADAVLPLDQIAGDIVRRMPRTALAGGYGALRR